MSNQNIKSTLFPDDLSFAYYTTKCKEEMDKFRPEWQTELNLPFHIQSDDTRIGILLLHGLFDTPFLTKDLAASLSKKNLKIRSLLLPGHGLTPAHLLDVQFEDWLACVKWGVESFKKEVDQVFVVGFSTGAILGLHQALSYPDSLAGVIMIAPVFKIRSAFDFVSHWHSLISWGWERAKWFSQKEEIDYTKYSSVPFNAIYQVYQLAKKTCQLNTARLKCPIFMILTQEDCIVSSPKALDYFQRLKDSRNRLLLYSSTPYITEDRRIKVRSSTYPAWNIQSISHIALCIAPHNAHYGMEGDFPLASHVEQTKNVLYGAYNKLQIAYYSFLYRLTLTSWQRARLTFNPDFDYMAQEIQQFIDNMYIKK